jgi:two-component system cell cycle sensor histidine kinase/response regulator CckA
LAGGVAHDFNNMLGVIFGYTELVMEEVNPLQPVFDDLQQIKQAAESVADTTSKL